jgi:filamentous hemagglutinin family protein
LSIAALTKGAKGGAIPLLICLTANLSASAVSAQIVQDDSLGAERSIVTPNVIIQGQPADLIQGGALRGANLFHSFSSFNIKDGQRVYFDDPGVTNILTRVTGQIPSNLLGTVGVTGGANLFLLNPNGIIFGRNARLDVSGSFVASTASAIEFGSQGSFSATMPTSPPALLSISPTAFFFHTIAPQAITNRSVNGLEVPTGKSLLLLGGNLWLEGGRILAPEGQIQLGAIAQTGKIPLKIAGDTLQFEIPDHLNRANLTLTNRAIVDASGNQAGSIDLQAAQVMLSGGSFAAANTFGTGTGGNLTISATEQVVLDGVAVFPNGAESPSGFFALAIGTGHAGNITIDTPQFLAQNGAQVSVSSQGQGSAGHVTIRATDAIQLLGTSDGNLASGLFAQVNEGTAGSPRGSITLQTQQLILQDGALIGASTAPDSNADGSNITIEATDAVQLLGTTPDDFPSAILTETGGRGAAGDLTISTGLLSILDGALITGGSLPGATGNSGNILVRADAVEVVGVSQFDSASSLLADNFGAGNGGSLTLNVGRLSIRDGGGVAARAIRTVGGTVIVNASEVEVIGTNPNGRSPSSLAAQVRGSAIGGNLTINTQQLSIQDGGQVSVSTFGNGRGGNLLVNADSIDIQGRSLIGRRLSSGLFAQVNAGATGAGGTLTVNARQLTLQGGGLVATGSLGFGNAGDLSITASESVRVIGIALDGVSRSTISSQVDRSGGAAGNVRITTGQLAVQQGGEITVSSFSPKNAGDLVVVADSLVLTDRSGLFAQTASGNGGNIILRLDEMLLLRHNSIISATSGLNGAGGDGGNITISAPFVVTAPLENSDIFANAFAGRGGRVDINAQNIFWLVPRSRAELETLLGTTDPTRLRSTFLPTNDATAISQTDAALSGIVVFNSPEVDSSQALPELPDELVDVAALVNQQLCAGDAGSEFVVTGRGGLPDSPNETLSADVVWEDWRIAVESEQYGRDTGKREQRRSYPVASAVPARIVEAQGWKQNANGGVELIADAIVPYPQPPWLASLPGCRPSPQIQNQG